MSIQTRIKAIENKTNINKTFSHTEIPIIELPDELKEQYKFLPYPIMGGLSTNEVSENTNQ